MKRVLYLKLFFAFFILAYVNSFAQTVTNYVFTPSSSTYSAISGGTVPALAAGNTDDGYFTNIPIGFNFYYNSVSYTFLSASTNGFISLGQNISNVNNQVNNLSTATSPTSPRPIIAGLWDDILLSATTDISYITTGTSPNRIFTLQFANVKWQWNAATAGISFQIKLYETTGKIEYVYTPLAGALLNPTASIGITNTGTGPLNFLSLTSTGNNPYDTSISVETTTLSTKPANGQSYAFVPKYIVPIAPAALTFSAIAPTSMNVNWTDNTTSETYYQVYISSDNITFNYLSTVYSTTSGTTGTAYQYTTTGLTIGTTYYFRVFAANEGSSPINYVSGSQSTASGILSGTKSICPSGCNYTSIGAANLDIRTSGVNGSLILELDSSYIPTVETYPLNFGNLLTSSASVVTLRPKSNVINPINFICFSSNSQTFDLNTTNYLTIDGRKGGTGTTSYITISNFNSNGTAIRFINGASNNTINYCKLSGATTSLNYGVVTFASTAGTTGNSNNTISNCTVKDTISNPIYAIYSSGNAAYPNLNNTITNSYIYDYYNGSNPTYGVYLTAGTDFWNISNNHFFQTSVRALSFTNAGAIFINTGASYTITGNYIGGSTINCGGGPMFYNGSGSVTLMNLNTLTGNTCTIQNNVIQNINMDMTGTPNSFISMANGAFSITGNSIGNTISTSTIRFTSSAAGTVFSPILLTGGTSYGNINISSNTIGGISVGGTGTTLFNGINITAAVPLLTINNNLIGSLTTPNSISDSTNQTLFGISATLPSTSNTISGNTIANLSLLNTSNTITNQLRGIYINSTGSFTVTGNVVKNLTTNSTSLIPNFNSPVIGILFSASGSNQICSMNTVNGLFSTNTTQAIWMEGIFYSGTSTGTNIISRNMVHGIVSMSSGASVIYGIFNSASGTTVYNNIVRLGVDTSGNDINSNFIFAGIVDANNSNSYYFNSVYIGGSGVTAGSNITAAFYNNVGSTGTRFIMNNIFNNSRSNNIGSGKNYAVYLTSGTLAGFTINNNIYYSPGIGGTIGRFNGTDYTTMNPWMVALSEDYNSGYGNPNYVNATGTSSTFSLNVQSPTPAESAGLLITTITDDYFGNSRSSYTPTDIGAVAGSFTGVDIFVPSINYTVFTNTASTSNRVLTATLTDVGTGVRNTALLQPRIWYRRSLPAVSGWFSTPGVLISGNGNNGTWNFTIDYSLIGGVVTTGNQYQYYIVAQDSASPINLFYNPLPGTSHTNVYNQVTPPTAPNSYSIVTGLPVVINVGAGQTYTTLTGAGGLFAAINSGALSGNTIATIVSDISEPGTNILANIGMGGYNLTIKPDASLRTLSGSLTTGALGLISINRAIGVTIDGGPSRNLVIRNVIGTTPSATTAPAVWIFTGNNDTIKNCIIEANNSTANFGTITLTNAGAASPSSGIVISNNIIRPPNNVNTNPHAIGILVSSAAGNIFNSTIGGTTGSPGGNQISDFTNYGIYIANAGNNLTIGHPTDTANGNVFFQTASRGTHYSILIGSGDNHIISSNKIYNTPGISHTAFVIGIYIFNSINNTTINNNSIGGSLSNRSGASYSIGATFYGIYFTGGSVSTSAITNNSISNISVTGASQFYGIYIGSGNVNVLNNIIGGASSTLNLYDNITTSQDFYGIRHNTSSNLNLSNNIISDLTNIGTGLSTGISIESGVANVTGNLIRNFIVNSTNWTNVDYSCNGIRISTTTSGNNIENNTIFNLANNSNTLSTSVCGIAVMGALNASTIQRNRIYNLSAASVNGGGNSPVIWGIYCTSTGSANYANNQISISQSIAGTQPRIRGIEAATSGGTNNFYYNSIYIGGIATGANITQAFYRNTISPASTDIKNNIFYNERSGGGNTHFAFTAGSVLNLTNNNNFFVTASANFPVDYPAGFGISLANWNSFSGNPLYNLGYTTSQFSSSQLFPLLAGGDLSTTVCRLYQSGTAVSVTNDFNNNSRNLTTPNIGSIEFTTPTGMPAITSQPTSPSSICPSTGTASMNVTATGYGVTYQWQENQGSSWSNLSNGGVYSGVTSSGIALTSPAITMNNYLYRVTVSGICTPSVNSNQDTLRLITAETWTGATNTNWGTATNWSCGYVPLSATDVIIPNIATQPVLTDGGRFANNITINSGASLTVNNAASNLSVSGNITNNGTFTNSNGTIVFAGTNVQTIPGGTYTNITLNNSAGASLSGSITLNGTMTFSSGIISLGNNNFTLAGTTSAISGSSNTNYFYTSGTGSLTIQNIGSGGRTGSVNFPVGMNTVRPNAVSLTNTGTSDAYSVRLFSGVNTSYNISGTPNGTAINTNSVAATWLISENVSGGSNATVTLQWWSGDQYSGFIPGNCYVAKYNGITWLAGSASIALGSSSYTQTLSGITSTFANTPFGVGSGGTLPVKLLSFNGNLVGKSVLLNWETSSEINNNYFDVERSIDNINFETIGKIKGNGTTNSIRNYQFTDPTSSFQLLTSGIIYYRLKQVDFNGTSEYSNSVSVNLYISKTNTIAVSPNPANDQIRIASSNRNMKGSQILISDMLGRKIFEQSVLNDTFDYTVSITELKTGAYILTVQSGDEICRSKFVKE